MVTSGYSIITKTCASAQKLPKILRSLLTLCDCTVNTHAFAFSMGERGALRGRMQYIRRGTLRAGLNGTGQAMPCAECGGDAFVRICRMPKLVCTESRVSD